MVHCSEERFPAELGTARKELRFFQFLPLHLLIGISTKATIGVQAYRIPGKPIPCIGISGEGGDLGQLVSILQSRSGLLAQTHKSHNQCVIE